MGPRVKTFSRTRHLVAPAAGLVIVASLLAACGSSPASSASGGGPKVINIGTWGPTTGPFAGIHTINDGTVAYLKTLSASGKFGNYKITVYRKNDQYNPSLTPGAVRSLVQQDHVNLMCGGVGSPENEAVSSYLASANVPDIAPASGTPKLFIPPVKTEYAVVPPYQREAANLVRFAIDKLHDTKIAIAYENDDVGVPAVAGAKWELSRHHLKPAAVVGFDVTATDLSSQAAELKASGAQFVLVWAVAPPMTLLANDSASVGYKPTWGGPFFAESLVTLDGTHGALTGHAYWESWLVPAASSEAAPIAAAAKKYFPSDFVDGYVRNNFIQGYELGYACGQVLAKAITMKGGITAANLESAANSMHLSGTPFLTGLTWNTKTHIGNVDEEVFGTHPHSFYPVTKEQVLPPAPLSP